MIGEAVVTAAGPAAPALEAQPFAFGRIAASASMRLAGIERLGERIARALRLAVEPIARAKVQVAADAIGPVAFNSWLHDLPEFTSLTHYRLHPLKGGALVAIEPAFVTRLVDSFYGGSGRLQKDKAREFTPTEDRLLGRLLEAASHALVSAWSDVVELEPVLLAQETNPSFVSFARGDEQVVVQSFTVTPGTAAPSALTIVYLAQGLRPFEPQLAAKVPGGAGEGDPEWRARLAHSLQQVRLPVRTVLARPEMRLSELMALKPGDVIPVTLPPRAPLIVADQRLALGTLGDREGKAALMIDEILRKD
jgi:flagellar motor switch protein FliM